jgi:plasmid stability protein
MRAITVKNIPDDLYGQLKLSAESHHRSINSELITCLERVLFPRKMTVDEHILDARNMRQRFSEFSLSNDDVNAAKNDGRK